MAGGKDIHDAVREVCLSLPGAEEAGAHGNLEFRVCGRAFASYVINLHGDGRVALWLNSPPGTQEHYVREEPRHFFVPPYVGPRGWLGVNLDQGLSWKTIARLVQEAWRKVAPAALSRDVGEPVAISPPTRGLAPEEIDPLRSKRAQAVLQMLRGICLALPETSEGTQFGHPVWRAGKRVFAQAWWRAGEDRLQLAFWVGVEEQVLLVQDPRFTIPPYIGHLGWIAVDVTRSADWKEIGSLARFSYRHFALGRMLKVLDARDAPPPRRSRPRAPR